MINIVFCLDKNIKTSLKSTISSILHNSKRKFSFYLICPKEDNNIFKKYIEEESIPDIKIGNFNPSNDLLDLIKNCTYYSKSKIANYSRFFIKDIFPELKKIIYLDTDILVLDDIGKLWDSVNFTKDNFFASPKYIWFHKIFYIKRLNYYFSYLNENNAFFNGGVFLTNLEYWDKNFYDNLYKVTRDLMENDVSHVFTEIILNVLFPNFIELNPEWNCSGYGNKKLFNLLKIRDYNLNPKIIHWSGALKPWHSKYIYLKELWEYYLNDKINGIYLLYYDDNTNSNKYLLESISKISYNLIPKNVFDENNNKQVSKFEYYKKMIEKLGSNNFYLILDSYNTVVLNFNYTIINFMLQKNVEILTNNSNLSQKTIFDKSLFGKGDDIIKLYFEKCNKIEGNNIFFDKFDFSKNINTFILTYEEKDRKLINNNLKLRTNNIYIIFLFFKYISLGILIYFFYAYFYL